MNSKLLFASIALGALLTAGSYSSEVGSIDGKGFLCVASYVSNEERTDVLRTDDVIWFEDGKVLISSIYEQDDVAKTSIGSHGDYQSTPATISWNYFGVEPLGVVTVNSKTLRVMHGGAELHSGCSVLKSQNERERVTKNLLAALQEKINLFLEGNKL
ncbi:hypothetical protein N9J36_04600 [Litoricola sp.]|nr:hypothetical protein [Litorivicinus sp.]